MSFMDKIGGALSQSGSEEPVTADVSSTLSNLGSLRSQLTQQASLPMQPLQGQQPQQSQVIDPVLDQLITHFDPTENRAQGEVGDLLTKAGF